MANFYKNDSNAAASGAVNYSIIDVALATGLGKLVGDLVVTRLVRNYSGDARTQGVGTAGSVRIPILGSVSAQKKTPGSAVTPSAAALTKGEIDIKQHATWDILIEDYGNLFTGPGLMQRYLTDGAATIAEMIEADVIGLYPSAGRILGAPQGQASATLITGTVRKQARVDKWRMSQPIYAVWGATAESQLLAVALFVQANESGSTEALVNARLGRKFGIEHFSSNQMPSIAGSPGAEHNLVFQSEGLGIAFVDLSEADVPAEFKNSTVTKRAMDYVDDNGVPAYTMRTIIGYSQLDRGYVLTVDSIYGVGVVRSGLVYDVLT